VGGGRKRAEEADESLEADFLALMARYTAGDPMDETVYWTSLSPREIADKLNATREPSVRPEVVRRLLKKHGYRRRKMSKKNAARGGESQ